MKASQRAFRFGSRELVAIRREFSVSTGLSIVFAGLSLLPAQLLHFFAINVAALSPNSLRSFLSELTAAGALIALGIGIAAFGRVFVKEWLGLKLESQIRLRLLNRFLELPLESLEGSSRQDWIARMATDIATAKNFLAASIPAAIYNVFLILGTTTLLFFLSGELALGLLGVAITLGAINLKIQNRLRPRLLEMRSLYSGLLPILVETLDGWKTVRSAQCEIYEKKRVQTQMKRFNARGIAIATLIGKAISTSDLLTHCLVVLVLLALAYGTAFARITINEVLYYPFYLAQFFYATQGLAKALTDWEQFIPSGERLYEALDQPHSVQRINSTPLAHSRSRDITLKITNVAILRLPPASTSLPSTISLELRGNEITVLSAPCDSGKSTFLEFLAGLRGSMKGSATVSQGNRLLWSGGGAAGFQIPVSLCAFVPQRPFIFRGTVRENLTLGRPELNDHALEVALAKVGLLHSFLARDGLAIALTERGKNLNDGEIYRIAIARVLLLNRPFLLLDEPFAALDPKSSEAVVETLINLKQECGIAIVTHTIPMGLRPNNTLTLDSQGIRSPSVGAITQGEGEIWVELNALLAKEQK